MEAIREKSSSSIRRQVARILFERAKNGSGGQKLLAQREIAEMLDTSWSLVHESLNSLFSEGAIRIDGNRIILKRELILKAAEEMT